MTKNITLHHRRVTKTLLFLFFFAFLFSGCARMVRTEQPSVGDMVSLSAGQTVGQTFVAKYDGLTGIFFYFSPSQMSGDGEMRLHLRNGPEAVSDLAVSTNTISIDQLQEPGYYGFLFPAQTSSNQKYYYAYIDFAGEGKLEVGKAAGDTYLNGALYQGGVPQDAQTAFQLKYSRRYALFGLGIEVLTWIGYLFVGLFLFVLPGWGLFSLLWPGWGKLAWPEKLGLSAGLSLAVYPLLLVLTDIIGLHLGAIYAWSPPIVSLGMILWKNRRHLNNHSIGCALSQRMPIKCGLWVSAFPTFVFIFTLALIFLARFWAIRSLEGPLWADSVQHTAIAQLILDHGGLFRSWLPYTPYQTLTVQFGFPAFAAVLGWITGFSGEKATILVGPIINGLAVLTLYPLAVRVAKGNHWAGTGAILVAGLISQMPAFYANWGRDAQLAGQAVLPIALWLVWEALASSSYYSLLRRNGIAASVSVIVFAAVALAGMTLSYYRMPFYYTAFILALFIAWGIPEWHLQWRVWVWKFCILVAVAVLAGLLFLPWGLRLLGSNLAGHVQAGIVSESPLAAVRAEILAWKNVFSLVPKALVIVALVGIDWSLIRKNWMTAAQGLWFIFLTLVIPGMLIHLPGANMMDSFTIMIAAYIPLSLVIGWMVSEIAGNANQPLRQSLLATVLIIVACYGVITAQRTIIQPGVYSYITRPDTLASEWIREYIPQDSLFFVEGIMYKWHSILGGDAGWWLPLLAGRKNTMPPQYALLNEEPIQPDYTKRMVSLVESMQTIPIDSLQAISMLCEEGVTHVYIGQLQGWAALKMLGAPQLFSPTILLNSPYYSEIYHQDRVYVFSLNRSYCP
jgi:hypothetical protein